MWIRYGLGDRFMVLVRFMFVMCLFFCSWVRMCRFR